MRLVKISGVPAQAPTSSKAKLAKNVAAQTRPPFVVHCHPVMRILFHWLIPLFLLFPIGIAASESDDSFELTLKSPFYTAYTDDWIYRLETTVRTQGFDIDFQDLNAIKKTRKDEYASELTITYGVFEFLAVGLSAKGMYASKTSETATGFLKNTPLDNSTENGFYDPIASVTSRLGGSMQGDWMLNLQLAFAPGIEDENNGTFSTPNNRYMATLLFGKEWGAWSFGELTIYQLTDKTSNKKGLEKNDQQVLAINLFAQFDFGPAYLRANSGLSGFIDSASQDNPIRRNKFLLVGGEIGVLLSDNFLTKIGVQWTGGMSDEASFIGPGNKTLPYTVHVHDSYLWSLAFSAQF